MSESLINAKEAAVKVGVSRPTLYRWIAKDQFPKPVRMPGATVRWLEREVDEWLNSRIADREAG